MYKIQPIIEHIERVYGLELVPCLIPSNRFQYFKRSFYIFIHNKVSKNLFFFLMNRSPIKYLDERPDKEIFFRKRDSEGRVSIEVEIKPLPTYQFIYDDDSSGLFHPINKEGENYKVNIFTKWEVLPTHYQVTATRTLVVEDGNILFPLSFPLNHINGTEQVDYYFSKVDELKQVLRDYKLKTIL